MKIGIASDFHWETQDPTPLAGDCDVLVVAGDALSGCDKRDLGTMLARWSEGRPLIFVPGNHEFETHFIDDALARMRQSLAPFNNIHFLYNDCIDIDGVRFLGSTLWTDFSLEGLEHSYDVAAFIESKIPDFRHSRWDGSHLTTREVNSEFDCALNFLRRQLKTNCEHKQVVVSHFAPLPQSLSPQFANSPMNPWFINCLQEELVARADLWIHGHTHQSFDYHVTHAQQTCRVVCNPHGFTQKISLDDFAPELHPLLKMQFAQLNTQSSLVKRENDLYQSPLIVQL